MGKRSAYVFAHAAAGARGGGIVADTGDRRVVSLRGLAGRR